MNRNYDVPAVAREWAETRETHIAVATAINAIATSSRSAEAIWAAPTNTEIDHVKMAVQEYIAHGDFQPETDSRYPWGGEAITL